MYIVWLWLGLLLGASASPPEPTSGPSGSPASTLLELTPQQAGRPTVLVLRKSTPNMDTFVQGMTSELQSDFNLVALEVSRASTPDEVGTAIGRTHPDVMVVLDNPTSELYRKYQEAHPGTRFPPAVLAMALFVEQTASRIQNATGIAYEVPAVTSFVRLRSTVKTGVKRIGVIHRPAFGTFIDDQARLAAIEGFEIVPYEVKQKPTVGQVRAGMRALDALGVDALWVLNDNVLLSPEILIGAWLPMMKKNRRPVVVGVADLLRTNPPVGSFAVLPDHQSLGMQTADLVFELRDAGRSIGRSKPQLPIAVVTVLNRPIIDRTVGLQPGALDQIDEVIE